ncbi:MAG: hypothetical protein COV76_02370 [Candidatus Omnitrophica bacterium CG11_big_fil_rev_8_21_14_0_20_64_10]|nr:MAG: hypothetical protein COV76_02370 [Candidatus Omnitrophica bacterium CG11_big_fil_rev_8_21_14_0_20_64_10]
MQRYRYIGRNLEGSRVRGLVLAVSPESAFTRLKDAGVTLVALVPAKGRFRRPIIGRVMMSNAERLFLLESWSNFLEAGMAMQTALLRIRMQLRNRNLALALDQIQADIDAGSTVVEALSRTKIFPPSWVSVLSIGEKKGDFVHPLKMLRRYAQRSVRFQQEVFSIFTMPLILLGLVAVWLWIFLLRVVPGLASLVHSVGGILPALLDRVILFTNWLGHAGPWIALGVASLLFVALVTRRANREMGFIESRIPLWTPGIGPIIANIQLMIISQGLQVQLEGGIPILDAVRNLSLGVGSRSVRRDLYQAYQKLEGGGPVAVALSQVRVISPMGHALLAAGEKSGKIPELMQMLSNHAQQVLTEQVKRLTILIRTGVVLAVGVLVGFLVIIFFSILLQTVSTAGLIERRI